MHEIALFVEDHAHRVVVGTLVERVAQEIGVAVHLQWRSATGGHGMVVQQLERYLRDLRTQGSPWPHLIVVATDANCQGFRERVRGVDPENPPAPVVLAVPDPHVERWLLLDGAAFKAVFGQGCEAPDRKCSRNRYKDLLIAAIRDAGRTTYLGGIEYAEDIVRHMDLDRAARSDPSLRSFVDNLRTTLRGWKQ